MKQLLQNLSSGKTELVEEPVPLLNSGHVLVQTRASLISAGTERMLVEFGRCSRNLVNTRILNSLSCDEIKEAG